jgi:uncharacterized protein (DUF1800 family)
MKAFRHSLILLAALALHAVNGRTDNYTDPLAPSLSPTTLESNTQKRISFSAYPSAEQIKMLRSDHAGQPWTEDASGLFSNMTWTAPLTGTSSLHRLQVTSLGSNHVLISTVLSKLAYGPTPDLLDRLATIGPEAYVTEQLNPETITERAPLANTNIAHIESRFGTPTNYIIGNQRTTNGLGTGDLVDLQAWLVLRAVFADRQLLEVLTQFWENHFVTYAAKDANLFIGFQFGGAYPTRAAAEWEWREVTKWREAMLRADWAFYDMLKISAESPAMIHYLDTDTSRANPPNIPNENYSRELQELFTMGVDNGYDQSDITNMAPAWAGWRNELVLPDDADDPFAPRSTVQIATGVQNPTAFTNLVGVWAFNFRFNVHGPNAKVIWGGKLVPARFGPPYTTQTYGGNAVPGLYELRIPARSGTNGIQDGYDIIRHLSMLPFTQEFISVKLCRLFVHDDFHIGYDYTDPNLSEEGKLVKACMTAWENNNGQMRPVLATIFNSALFRGQGGNSHKVKTPLEYAASAIRALCQSTNGTGLHGTWTANSDGYGIVAGPGANQRAFQFSALNRMGSMLLFNREAPDGYPETGSGWVDAGSMAERIRFISSYLKAVGQTGKDDQNAILNNNVSDPARLLMLRLSNADDLRDASKVAETILGLLYPGEGRANLDYYHQVAVNYLNTADDGTTSSPLSILVPSNTAGTAYDTRVRGMVAMLLSLQRFHEQ